MKPSVKQKQILDFASKNQNKISKKQAVDLIGYYYYHNAQKYVGEVLSRMVTAGFLTRVKKGNFKVNEKRKETVNNIVNPNQLELL